MQPNWQTSVIKTFSFDKIELKIFRGGIYKKKIKKYSSV